MPLPATFNPDAWLDKAKEHLEWPRLEASVLARCKGEPAKSKGLTFALDRAQAQLALRECGEMMALLERGDQLPLAGLREIEPHLQRLERKGALSLPALIDVLQTLRCARQVRSFLGGQRGRAPLLCAAYSTDPALDRLEQQLDDAIEADGTLSDRASPELRSLRTEIANLRERIIGRLQQLLERYEDVLSDRYYTLRDGRYVLPVRRDAHERVHGIVHGTSQSGSSVFVEPRAVLAQGNRLKMAESELEREQDRVLAALSELVAEYGPSLRAAAEAMRDLDLRHAAALLGRELGGVVPELCDEPVIALNGARHPLLVLEGVAAVPNDIALSAERGLVISGPNAAGKTVLLKTLGLFALMIRHGLPIGAAPGSSLGFFERVLTDVGDEQSTERNLSTFSAHITNLVGILATADAGALVLLDELATGTDPEQGAALACAVLDALCRRGSAFAVTTHYEPLKAMSLRDPRLRAASVGFDIERMEPTFRLALDVPGVSNALVVARRFGMPEDVLAFAERALPDQARDFEQLVRALSSERETLYAERSKLAGERAELGQVLAAQQERLQALRKQGDAEVKREVGELTERVRAARSELDRARAAIKTDTSDKRELALASKRIADVAARVALGGDLTPAAATATTGAPRAALDAAELRTGQRVHVPRLRSEAVIVEGPTKGRVRVAVGPLKLWVDSDGLLTPDAAVAAVPALPHTPASITDQGRNSDNTLNLKGMRVDDALSLLETFVDRLRTADTPVGYVLHGHGTGALRDAVRKHLKTVVQQIADVRPAHPDDGGDAVTMFSIAVS
ncbi:MAG TPA: Smr/MutS family protein [Polyangiales bacterium]|nr:Smr/MutS family protein [Polyangiales bacterium]